MIQINNKQDCCGCTACDSICGHNAIEMKPDDMGFLYPVVNTSLCVDCGLCDKVCQFNDKYERYGNFEDPLVFGCRHSEIKELEFSQSGAASWAIIQKLISDGGVVYGAGFETPTHIVHKRASELEDCKEFRGSKYVQSDIRQIFSKIREDLIAGIKVLFVGTPCQVAGLKSYIPNRFHDKLLTVDLVCHATPSPAVWKSYVEYYEKKYNSKAQKVYFRNKNFGWHSHIETVIFTNGSQFNSEIFRSLFYEHLIIRDSCANCPYTNFKRVADLTIGDFWGWEINYEEWNDNKGVSLLLVNSAKGKDFLNKMKNISLISSDIAKCSQPQLNHPIQKNPEADRIVDIFKKKGYKGIAIKYGYAPGYKYYRKRLTSYKNKIVSALSKLKHRYI